MDELRVRVYNVRFGDAVLLTIPDKDPYGETVTRHVLLDVGNSLTKEGGADEVFEPVVADILKELDGKPLDLYMMTHEHMDHIQGLPYAERFIYTDSEYQLKNLLNTQYAWLTASAAEDYYEKNEKAKKTSLRFNWDLMEIDNYIHSAGFMGEIDQQQLAFLESIIGINNPRSSVENVAYLRELAEHTYYVYRGIRSLNKKHPFHETKFKIWAPEKDTFVYYGYYHSPALGMTDDAHGGVKTVLRDYEPPAGVDAGVFYDLIESRRQFAECLLSIDKAKNNTSIVCSIEWRGWCLLFTGDAELKSWKIMRDKRQLKKVDFLKVSHHGSHNGTPGEDILDRIFPKQKSRQKERRAVVSTWHETYPGVPDADTLTRLYDPQVAGLQPRCDSLTMVNEDLGDELFVDFVFPG